MAAAGFIRFYHHANDCVKCLDCGLCLDSWKPDDLPLDEHAGRKPKCPFVMALTAAEAPSNAALKNSSGAETAQMSKAILQLDEQQHSTSASTAQSIMSPTLQLQKDLAAERLKVLKAKIQKLKERQTRVGNQLVAEKEAHRKTINDWKEEVAVAKARAVIASDELRTEMRTLSTTIAPLSATIHNLGASIACLEVDQTAVNDTAPMKESARHTSKSPAEDVLPFGPAAAVCSYAVGDLSSQASEQSHSYNSTVDDKLPSKGFVPMDPGPCIESLPTSGIEKSVQENEHENIEVIRRAHEKFLNVDHHDEAGSIAKILGASSPSAAGRETGPLSGAAQGQRDVDSAGIADGSLSGMDADDEDSWFLVESSHDGLNGQQ